MSDKEQDPTADPDHQSNMPSTGSENASIITKENYDDLTELSGIKNCDGLTEPSDTQNCIRLPEPTDHESPDGEIESATKCDGLIKSETKCDDLIEFSATKECDGLTEPADVTGEDEVECGEISSPKVPEDVKPFAVECELDFEEEAESASVSSKKAKDKAAHTSKEQTAEGDDDGECSDEVDEEDLEEGELKDEAPGSQENNATSKPSAPTKTVCRFYNRGQCFYGNNCRFLHVNFLKTGNYSMFAPARVGFADAYDPTAVPVGSMTHGLHRPGPRTGSEFSSVPPLLGSQASQPAALETAWERGLREAKELVKKANKRKIEEPDFEEKRLNLSLVVNEKNVYPEEENEAPYKKKKRDNSTFPKRDYDDPHDVYDDGYEARPHWREGHFDNMDVRYHKEQRRDRGRGRLDRERDKFPKSPDRNKERFRDDRLQQVQSRSRVDDYFDPWRRSKSPKGNLRRTRSRSGSYSSVSSYSYSDRSSRSSCSYSHSSSRSSSRSPHPHQKRTPSPPIANPTFASPSLGPNKFTTMKKKPGGRPNSRSRTPSISRSRSRSFSRSISMDSVSSASSSISRSSHSEPGQQNSHGSILRKQETPSATVDVKPDPTIIAANPPAIPLPTAYLNYNPPNKDIVIKVEKNKDTPKEPPPTIDDDERDPLEEKFLTPISVPFPSLQHLLPGNDKVREPFKAPSVKQQIKLTLLNKNPKVNNLPMELDVNRQQNDEPLIPTGFYLRSPLSPPVAPVVAKPTPVLVPKKSASSRRDELLKQLKAVEDAIARKRAKFG